MKIKEVSELTGMTKKTIRFYESCGLLIPHKKRLNGKDFRFYSDADIARLRQIASMRKVRFTISEIKTVLDTPAAFSQVFEDYYKRIREEKDQLLKLVEIIDCTSDEAHCSVDIFCEEIVGYTNEKNLPAIDLHPHFKYIDIMEEKLANRQPAKNHLHNKKKSAAVHQTFSAASYQTKPGVRDGSMNGVSVLMTMQLFDENENIK